MTIYNVHIFREMRITFGGIEAATPDEAAALASAKPTGDADDIDDCDGEDLSAVVDTFGDEDFSTSVTIDFDDERCRKAASALLAALESIIDYAEAEAYSLDKLKDSPEVEVEAARAFKAVEAAGAALERAKSQVFAPPPEIDVHAVLAARRQIADVWSVLDVKSVRPDLGDEQAWQVLRHVSRHYDAAVGINWDVLHCAAQQVACDDLSEAQS